jgi:hypothetical protein
MLESGCIQGSPLDHRHVLRCQPARDGGPVVRCSTFPGSDGLDRNLHVRKSVTNHGFNHAGANSLRETRRLFVSRWLQGLDLNQRPSGCEWLRGPVGNPDLANKDRCDTRFHFGRWCSMVVLDSASFRMV